MYLNWLWLPSVVVEVKASFVLHLKTTRCQHLLFQRKVLLKNKAFVFEAPLSVLWLIKVSSFCLAHQFSISQNWSVNAFCILDMNTHRNIERPASLLHSSPYRADSDR